jgi:hypothetical protein
MATVKDSGGEKGGLKNFLFAAIGTCCLGLPFGFFLADVVAPTDLKKTEAVDATTSKLTEGGEAATAKDKPSGDAGAEAVEVVSKGPFEIVPLPPIITNIADPPKVWVRLEGNLVFDKSHEPDSALLSAKLAQHVMAYLNTLKLSDMQGAGAVHGVSQDLDEIVTTLSDGQVQGLLLSGLVFE